MDDGPEDPRLEELASLEAIFPEIQRPAENDPFTFILELPVKPANPVTVAFPAASAATSSDLTAPAAASTASQPAPVRGANGAGQNQANTHQLSYLPPVSLRMSLPPGYPLHKPPGVQLRTTPQWLPSAKIKTLEADATRLWEMGHDVMAYSYIDHIQQTAEDVFGMVSDLGTLEVDLSHMVAILDHDIKARRAAFESETFDCGICLDPKKGLVCHRMMDCGHVFCLACLQDFYGEAIKQGDVNLVRCLSPGCTKARETEAEDAGKRGRKATASISPGELLAIGLSQDVVSRYVKLKYKKELESDKTTVYCPRRWCDGAAVSKRHKKPKGLELQEPEGDDAEENNGGAAPREKPASRTEDLLAVCEDCAYAFCIRCKQSWHGEFVRCRPKADDEGELTAEDQASLEYIRNWTRPCASCDAPAQKTEGCNHMICYRCNTHFCYLCSAWLDPRNPYSHFNRVGYNECYQRLWDLEGGHGDNADYVGGVGARRLRPVVRERPGQAFPEFVAANPVAEERERPGGGNAREGGGGGDANGEAGGPGNVQVEREGPLVLRIEQQRARREPAPPPAPARGGHQDGPRRGRGGRQNARRGRARGDVGQNRGPPAQARPQAPEPPPVPDLEPWPAGGAEEELNEQQRAWVRRFVQLALADEEDSGSEDEENGLMEWD